MTGLAVDKKWTRVVRRNGIWLILPPLAISFALWSALPAAYSPERFGQDIPSWFTTLENIMRILIFALPGILSVEKAGRQQTGGWIFYSGGLVIYFASYGLLIWAPDSAWSQSWLGFTAPAWSPGFWLCGIGLLCGESWLLANWNRAIYLAAALLFLILHVGHAGLTFSMLG